ncbi:MAG TPA: WecB/TagA/CpsF family glycosyltransferase [Dinghuibacter sp.]|uniref:WecB/TagA/CpsF family glycosyltransferase n=1 Tax=Dinghuibacter sp. TaxID=2024697 RepID=UPI002BA21DD4|nr:WecB/TagA/CpsF family glycosyltransferase [Dinghuibacter sp.]HTJ10462.1 WecB/TagA/CpsF family glycosyltransferase [Dinghuibacter sp.]
MKQPFLNLRVDNLTATEALCACVSALDGLRPRSLFFLNAHCFVLSQRHPSYHDALYRSDFVFNDGIGIKCVGLLNNIRFTDNLNGTDLIPKIIDAGVRDERTFYFVGGAEGVTHEVRDRLVAQYGNIRIAGARSGYFTETEEAGIIRDINSKNVDILIVGMGAPLQELWIEKIRPQLTTVRLCIAGGAIFDFMSGKFRRAPPVVRRANLEWAYRLYLEPGRLWKRYVYGAFALAYHVFRHWLPPEQPIGYAGKHILNA